jgi:hypothetical protein
VQAGDPVLHECAAEVAVVYLFIYIFFLFNFSILGPRAFRFSGLVIIFL